MIRKKYYRKRDDDIERALTGIFTLISLALIWYFLKNPAKSIAYIFIFIAVILFSIFLIKWWRKKHFNNLLNKLKNSGQEDYLRNFINRFGLEGQREFGYEF